MMELDRFHEAVAAVRELQVDPDSAGGAVLLTLLLKETGAAPSRQVEESSVSASTDSVDPAGHSARVADWSGIDLDRVDDILEFGDEQSLLRLPARRLPRSKADRQRVLVLLKLSVDRVAYDRADVPAKDVNAICLEYACLDQNLPNNVASRGDLATRRGSRGAYTYRATQPGLQRARELLQEVVNGDGELKV
jgi:hypothetical protein